MALPDIVEVLGQRPYPLKESLLEYLEELRERKVEEDKIAKEEEQKQEKSEENEGGKTIEQPNSNEKKEELKKKE